MPRIHPPRFRIAGRGTPREINRQILLNLVRSHQPVSRADLARMMGTTRAAVTFIVNDLIGEGFVYEGAKGEAPRGRKPQFLYIDSRKRWVLAVDIRATRTSLTVCNLLGEPLVGVTSFATETQVKKLVKTLADRVKRTVGEHRDLGECQGIGVVVPGMVGPGGERVLFSPRLGWRDVPLREMLAAATRLPVTVENSGRACALAQIWSIRADATPAGDLAFVNVSDGIGVGIVVRGEVLRGLHNVAGEFGHIPLNVDGPPCACGATGCWESYVSNLATLSRYFGREVSPRKPMPVEMTSFTVDDLIARARGGDGKAIAAVQATARYLGLGLASLVNAVDPARIYLSGEIIGAWDLIEGTTRRALAERALAPAAASTSLVTVSLPEYPRLRGAAALVAAPVFAVPSVA
ncbi:MAG TPA: ROK family protein [Vicinamibacterales bacterium]|jgi:predicted NBD/HSP70 family sugar kinase